MELLFKTLLSPLAWAVGFLWPLFSQSLIALEYLPSGWIAIAVGAAIAIPLGIAAQFRGSWIWIKP